MCGRFALALRAEEIEQLDEYPALRIDQWVDRDHFVPRYNIAPRTRAPVIRRAQPGDKAEPPTLNTINARAENLEEGGGMWGSMKGRKRCVVVAQGYYEWLKKGTQRIPHFTRHKDRRLMLFAGLYDSVTLDGQSEPLWTFTIVTTAASSDFTWLHDRQPVILTSQDAIDRWLDTSTQNWDPKLSRLLDPYSDSDSPLECYAVPQEVGRVGVESPTFIEPVEKRKDGIEALFTRQANKAKGSTQKKKDDEPDALSSLAGGKRKREPSPLEGKIVINPASSSPSAKYLDHRDRNVKTESPIAADPIVDVDDTGDASKAADSDSDVEILPGRLQPSDDTSSLPREKPKMMKKGQGDSSPPSSSQRRHPAARSSPPPQSTTSAPKRKRLKPTTATGTPSPPPRKKREKSEHAKSTPKITSFFAKT
ncbi:DUF159-domain-containing protein [Lactarius psammicola]|nr:DUF159-domain-containing protein [Lactarius psammicola]